MILTRIGFDFNVLEAYRLDKFLGRFIAFKIEISGATFLISNIYAPNDDSPQFFSEVFVRLEKTGLDKKIIGGDFI